MAVSEFIIKASTPELFPAESLPEVAFLGRSNVGKSSLINVLTQQKGLARTSATPGCTQAVQFYRVRGQYHFVDLPGYGYAKVSREEAARWRPLIESYLLGRESLSLCLLLLDARRGWMDMDTELRDWLRHQNLPYRVVATKIDKLKTQREKNQTMAALRDGDPDEAPLTFSAVTGQGAREIWQAISTIKTRP